ncbi:hypothetical protein K6119_04095 [Paracrocinitomix mangrovi]|uniref:hypothetical protein n=1 Tax=Paracrocinitomix mangrovi TaxID=2862509 RepID=UPI001C8DD89E|nr:hypothetical protein [Paracrocinitomix mangrovi]UKN02694.1 hypothetical protein K6119_04095 [Paracrocinitomix mangrovi]
MNNFKNPHRSPKEAWTTTQEGIDLVYPIFHHDTTIVHDPIIKRNVKEVCGDIDFWSWDGNENDRFVDSTGKVFLSKNEKSGIWASGQFPAEVERTMDISEIKGIMKMGIDTNKSNIKEDSDLLKLELDKLESIQEVLLLCARYF